MQARFAVAGLSLLLACSSEPGDSTPQGSAGAPGGASGVSGAPAASGSGGVGGAASPGATGGTSPGTGGSLAAGSSSGGSVNATGGVGGGGAPSGGAAGASAGASGAPSAGSGGTPDGDGGSGGATAGSGGTGGDACTRASLESTTKAYLEALSAHDPSKASIAPTVKYTENTEEVEVGEGLWESAGDVKLLRTLVDTEQCTTVSEVVLPENGEDVVMALRLKSGDGGIAEIEAIITREGDWLFSAEGYLESADQKWDILPEDQRSTREQLIDAARAYFDVFDDKSVQPPFGPGCQRLEGGQATAPCNVGIPEDRVVIGNRRFFADVEAGVSVGIALFGSQTAGLLDVHFFRLIDGTIRNVHSMTVNESVVGTGWPQGEE